MFSVMIPSYVDAHTLRFQTDYNWKMQYARGFQCIKLKWLFWMSHANAWWASPAQPSYALHWWRSNPMYVFKLARSLTSYRIQPLWTYKCEHFSSLGSNNFHKHMFLHKWTTEFGVQTLTLSISLAFPLLSCCFACSRPPPLTVLLFKVRIRRTMSESHRFLIQNISV